MRILSPYKDFYDFVVTEPDNKKFYLRETKEVVFTELEHKKNPERTNLNKLFNCPALVINNANLRNIVLNPKLNEMGFNKDNDPYRSISRDL